MITTDNPPANPQKALQKKTAKTPSPRLTDADPWHDWKPDYRRAESPHARQEKLSPTESVHVRMAGEKTQAQSQRRIVDARLWDAMTQTQQQAALQIALAYETMGRGLGYTTSNWQRIPGAKGGDNIAERHARLINDYIEWTKACHKDGVSHSMIIDVLVLGFPCRLIDRDRRVRPGATRRNLLQGLSLYCTLRGWPA